MNEWQPIDTAPAVGRKQLLFYSKAYNKQFVGHRVAGYDLAVSPWGSMKVSHWMPLPPRPVQS